ncbi:MAG: hypothetical protein ACI4PC_07275 [Oscillospiraceae bacterium]
MGQRAERMILALSGERLWDCAEWLVGQLEKAEDAALRESRNNGDAEASRQTGEELFARGLRYQGATPGELALAEQFVRRAEEQAARDAEQNRLADEEDLRRTRKLWLAMSGGGESAGEAEETTVPQETAAGSAGAGVSAGESAGAPPGMDAISEFFRRDSRRYDGGFVRY